MLISPWPYSAEDPRMIMNAQGFSPASPPFRCRMASLQVSRIKILVRVPSTQRKSITQEVRFRCQCPKVFTKKEKNAWMTIDDSHPCVTTEIIYEVTDCGNTLTRSRSHRSRGQVSALPRTHQQHLCTSANWDYIYSQHVRWWHHYRWRDQVMLITMLLLCIVRAVYVIPVASWEPRPHGTMP